MKVLFIFGTRPEAIKMAPVVQELVTDSAFESKVCVTAQHRQMLDQVLELFAIVPDYDLDIMRESQDLFDVTSRVLLGLRDVMRIENPDLVLVQGDTTTCFAGSLAAFYLQIPVGHVEAGLRTGNMYAPFPEEANRAMTSRVASFHFAPTGESRQNLLAEGISDDAIHVTGNTVIDSLLWVRERVRKKENWAGIFGTAEDVILKRKPYVLITSHRRENFGQGLKDVCEAIATLAANHPETHFIYPVHLNPNVQQPVYSALGAKKNIHLISPLDYAPFVYAMDCARLILTDSGGVQEEAPSLGKPVLVMRETTERPEAVAAGTVLLVGTDKQRIIAETEQLLIDQNFYNKIADRPNPYGDGKAAARIKMILKSSSLKKDPL